MQISPVIETEHQLARPWREDWIIHSDSDTLELPLSSSYELVLLPRPELGTAPGLQQASIKWKPELAFISCLNDDWVVVTVEFIFVITFCRRSLLIHSRTRPSHPFHFHRVLYVITMSRDICYSPSSQHAGLLASPMQINLLNSLSSLYLAHWLLLPCL